MLSWLATELSSFWGPFRLLASHSVLLIMAFAFSSLICWIFLPRLWKYLPRDGGRQHAVNSEKSIGKPVSAGILFVTLFFILGFLFIPFETNAWHVLPVVLAAAVLGYVDDKKKGGLHEYTLAIADLALAVAAAAIITQFNEVAFWIPFYTDTIVLPAWLSLAIMTVVIWFSINATNCTDGVDGLSGFLSMITILILVLMLYGVMGHSVIASYLLVPHNPDGAGWAILGTLMIGIIIGYLWYNVPPSAVMMGDSGSRPIGLLIGILVCATQNPFLIFVTAFIILVNGTTGLFKVALMRFFNIRILQNTRFPLHDHVRKNFGWSDTQVLMRFAILHLFISMIFIALVLKIR